MTGRRGRTRSEQARVAILQATARQFTANGYRHLSIEGVAAEAGVGKQTIYRWWSSKGELIADCLFEGLLLPRPLRPSDTGDLRTDLTSWLRDIFDFLQAPGGEDLLRSLVAAGAENARVGQRIRQSLGGTSALADRLRSAIAAGQLPPDSHLEEFSDMLVGTLLLRAIARVEATEESLERMVEVLLGPHVLAPK